MKAKIIFLTLALCLGLSFTASADLVALYQFDSDFSDTAGHPLGPFDGVVTGSPTVVDGKMVCPGGTAFVSCGTYPGSADDLTIAFWMMSDVDTGYHRPVGKLPGGDTATAGWGFLQRPSAESNALHLRIGADQNYGGWPDACYATNAYEADVWVHICCTFDSATNTAKFYINGELVTTATGITDRTVNNTDTELTLGIAAGYENFVGQLDDIAIWDNALTDDEVLDVYTLGPLALDPRNAGNPNPPDEATDVPRDVVLSWTPGIYADKHDVYFGDNFDDVNDATTASAVYQGRQAGTTFAPDWLEFGTTYYWRIDEVNAPPTSHIEFKGEVWSFTTEPYAYPIENITATASSSDVGMGPENTINGSGLDANDLHSTVTTDMWLSGAAGPQPTWIQYEFDRAYKLHQMWVWNYNAQFENIIGFGLKDVTIQYSTNGVDWKALSDVRFAWGPGAAGYAHDTIVDFGSVVAKYVKITAKSNWRGQAQYGLSEVRFFYVPVWPREPNPASGATDVDLDVVLSWRAGREAATHEMYFSTSQQAVINGTAPVDTLTEASYGPLSLDLGKTYYWRVDEANDLETPTTWKGDVWKFRTHEFIAVEDFESYNDYCNRIFYAWKDGWGHSADPDCGVVASGGNGTGSTVGNLSAPFAEQTIIHSGAQSMPFEYDNSGPNGKARYSEAQREWAVPQDWTKGNVKALTLWFHGETGNTPETLYVALEDNASQVRVATHPDPGALQGAGWQEWNIALQQFSGVNLASVKKMYLGVGNRNSPQMGGSGKLYFDDIRLYPSKCVLSRRSADFAKVDYVQDCVVDHKELEVMAENWLAVPAATGIVPNGDFELMYKPGTAITGVVSDGGWTQGVGPDCPIDDGQYVFSDETTGTVADISGWVGYDKDGWIALGGTYGRDETTGSLQGSVARQGNHTPDGLHCYLANGGGWGNAAGGLIVSDAPLGNVEDGIYTLSMVARGSATPVVLDLLAGGIALTPSSSVAPDLTGDWQEFSRTYGSASLVGHIGQPLTIVLGVGRNAAGNQTQFDDVTLLHGSEPLPILPLAGRRVDLYEDKKIDFKDFAVLADMWLEELLWP
jgi:hypothetical protein